MRIWREVRNFAWHRAQQKPGPEKMSILCPLS